MAENSPSDSGSTDYAQGVTYFQETMDKFISTADVSTVYARPVRQGDTIIIPTAEVMCGMGFGFGMGQGMGPQQGAEEKGAESRYRRSDVLWIRCRRWWRWLHLLATRGSDRGFSG